MPAAAEDKGNQPEVPQPRPERRLVKGRTAHHAWPGRQERRIPRGPRRKGPFKFYAQATARPTALRREHPPNGLRAVGHGLGLSVDSATEVARSAAEFTPSPHRNSRPLHPAAPAQRSAWWSGERLKLNIIKNKLDFPQLWTELCSFQNSHVEGLTPRVPMFGGHYG